MLATAIHPDNKRLVMAALSTFFRKFANVFCIVRQLIKKSPLPPLIKGESRLGGTPPFVKGGREGFKICRHNYKFAY